MQLGESREKNATMVTQKKTQQLIFKIYNLRNFKRIKFKDKIVGFFFFL